MAFALKGFFKWIVVPLPLPSQGVADFTDLFIYLFICLFSQCIRTHSHV